MSISCFTAETRFILRNRRNLGHGCDRREGCHFTGSQGISRTVLMNYGMTEVNRALTRLRDEGAALRTNLIADGKVFGFGHFPG
jgi:hypothetical protein